MVICMHMDLKRQHAQFMHHAVKFNNKILYSPVIPWMTVLMTVVILLVSHLSQFVIVLKIGVAFACRCKSFQRQLLAMCELLCRLQNGEHHHAHHLPVVENEDCHKQKSIYYVYKYKVTVVLNGLLHKYKTN